MKKHTSHLLNLSLRIMSKVAERKIINEKIAKVREVVHGVSTNDIILALYSLDMNVERTIQAFCEADGASEVLDDWVRPSGGSSKNKNKKKKNKQPVESVPSAAPATAPVAAAAATVAPSTASASKVVKAAPPVKGKG
ncbi:Spermatogenesis-associated serine-rich protein 2 [Trichostrongylus colubriformis]|uniref:Spermatogenesis-associated serine-rich protein 2 n=1 Tax=Trichostrongylus colubriformis TaxID=6319 RepID=A0AAN8J3B9_TRICO